MQSIVYDESSRVQYVEKYRPRQFDDVTGNEDIVYLFKAFAKTPDNIPHLLLYGPAGVGKTTLLLCLVRHLFDVPGRPYTSASELAKESAVLFIDASSERQQKDVSGRIRLFCNVTSVLCRKRGVKKMVILDEIDNMTEDAQNSLREVITANEHAVRFFMTCNNVGRVITPVQSRCTVMSVSRLTPLDVRLRLLRVIEKEGLRYTERAVDHIAKACRGDMRRSLNVLQAVACIPPPEVTEERVRRVCCEPDPFEVECGLVHAWRGDFAKSLATFERMRRTGHSCADILGMVLVVLGVLDPGGGGMLAGAGNSEDRHIMPGSSIAGANGAINANGGASTRDMGVPGWHRWRMPWDTDDPDGRKMGLVLTTVDIAGSFHLAVCNHVESPITLWSFVARVCSASVACAAEEAEEAEASSKRATENLALVSSAVAPATPGASPSSQLRATT